MIPFAAALARFGSTLASGMGRMSSMAASTGSRVAMNSPKAASGGAKVGSSSLDKFISSQEKLNKINNKSNMDNIKYMNKFENSMLRVERIMSRMSKYSLTMSSSFKVAGGILAALSFNSITNSIRSNSPESKFMAGAAKTTLAQMRALQKAGEKWTNANMLVNMDYKLGSLAVAAMNMPGSKEASLLSSLRINPRFMAENAGMHRINTLLDAYKSQSNNSEIVGMISEILELSPAQLDELYRLKGNINKTYTDRLNEVNNETLENLTRYNQRLIEMDQQVESSYTRMTEALAPITTWLNELWGKIKMGFFDGITATIEGLTKAFKNLGEWIDKLWNGIKKFYDWLMNLFGSEDKSGIQEKHAKEMDKTLVDTLKNYREKTNDDNYIFGQASIKQFKEHKPKIVKAFKDVGWFNKDFDKWFKKQGEELDELEEEYKDDPNKLVEKVIEFLLDYQSTVSEKLRKSGEFDLKSQANLSSIALHELMRNYLGINGLTARQLGEYKLGFKNTNIYQSEEHRKNFLLKIYTNNNDINSQPENIEQEYR